jgi:hypothetical protein
MLYVILPVQLEALMILESIVIVASPATKAFTISSGRPVMLKRVDHLIDLSFGSNINV